MNIAEKEYHSRKTGSKPVEVKTTNIKKLEQTPVWFNKDIEENSATEEEIRQLEAMLEA